MNPDISYVARFDDEEEEDERRSADEDYEYDHDYDPIYYAEKCFTVAIVGSCGVGKTALTFQFVNDMKYFVEAYFPTVEDEYLLERKVGDQSQKIKLVDTSGHEDYRQLCQNTVAAADAFLFVYSVTNRDSFERIKDLVEEIRLQKQKTYFPCVIVANKSDLKQVTVSLEEGKKLAKEVQAEFLTASAKTSTNITPAFQTVIRRLFTFNACEFSGYLCKKGGGKSAFGRKNWKKRWFRLDGANLIYTKSYKSKRALGTIPLPAVKAIEPDPSDNLKFTIVAPDRSYTIQAKDIASKNEWMVKLRQFLINSDAQHA
eukprot:m.111680 g.111680  ORF g.111680 m.111680 type:complete len:315 (-) comp13454_c0_seq4:391-1335(-)